MNKGCLDFTVHSPVLHWKFDQPSLPPDSPTSKPTGQKPEKQQKTATAQNFFPTSHHITRGNIIPVSMWASNGTQQQKEAASPMWASNGTQHRKEAASEQVQNKSSQRGKCLLAPPQLCCRDEGEKRESAFYFHRRFSVGTQLKSTCLCSLCLARGVWAGRHMVSLGGAACSPSFIAGSVPRVCPTSLLKPRQVWQSASSPTECLEQ